MRARPPWSAWTPSRAVRRVLFDIGVRQVRRPDRSAGIADAEVDGDLDVVTGQVDVAGTGCADAVDADREPVEGHADPLGVKPDGSHADRGEHATPVGVGTEQGGLDEAVAGDDAR